MRDRVRIDDAVPGERRRVGAARDAPVDVDGQRLVCPSRDARRRKINFIRADNNASVGSRLHVERVANFDHTRASGNLTGTRELHKRDRRRAKCATRRYGADPAAVVVGRAVFDKDKRRDKLVPGVRVSRSRPCARRGDVDAVLSRVGLILHEHALPSGDGDAVNRLRARQRDVGSRRRDARRLRVDPLRDRVDVGLVRGVVVGDRGNEVGDDATRHVQVAVDRDVVERRGAAARGDVAGQVAGDVADDIARHVSGDVAGDVTRHARRCIYRRERTARRCRAANRHAIKRAARRADCVAKIGTARGSEICERTRSRSRRTDWGVVDRAAGNCCVARNTTTCGNRTSNGQSTTERGVSRHPQVAAERRRACNAERARKRRVAGNAERSTNRDVALRGNRLTAGDQYTVDGVLHDGNAQHAKPILASRRAVQAAAGFIEEGQTRRRARAVEQPERREHAAFAGSRKRIGNFVANVLERCVCPVGLDDGARLNRVASGQCVCT